MQCVVAARLFLLPRPTYLAVCPPVSPPPRHSTSQSCISIFYTHKYLDCTYLLIYISTRTTPKHQTGLYFSIYIKQMHELSIFRSNIDSPDIRSRSVQSYIKISCGYSDIFPWPIFLWPISRLTLSCGVAADSICQIASDGRIQRGIFPWPIFPWPIFPLAIFLWPILRLALSCGVAADTICQIAYDSRIQRGMDVMDLMLFYLLLNMTCLGMGWFLCLSATRVLSQYDHYLEHFAFSNSPCS